MHQIHSLEAILKREQLLVHHSRRRFLSHCFLIILMVHCLMKRQRLILPTQGAKTLQHRGCKWSMRTSTKMKLQSKWNSKIKNHILLHMRLEKRSDRTASTEEAWVISGETFSPSNPPTLPEEITPNKIWRWEIAMASSLINTLLQDLRLAVVSELRVVPSQTLAQASMA